MKPPAAFRDFCPLGLLVFAFSTSIHDFRDRGGWPWPGGRRPTRSGSRRTATGSLGFVPSTRGRCKRLERTLWTGIDMVREASASAHCAPR
eukprot:scaffold27031_cov63-Phaeocystis_antarctica.AAC.3